MQFKKVRAKPPAKCGFRLARERAKTVRKRDAFFRKKKTSHQDLFLRSCKARHFFNARVWLFPNDRVQKNGRNEAN